MFPPANVPAFVNTMATLRCAVLILCGLVCYGEHLEISPIHNGVVVTEGVTAYTVKSSVNAFVIIGDRDHLMIGKLMSSLNDVAHMIDRIDPWPNMRRLLQKQKKAMEDELIEVYNPSVTRTRRSVGGLFGVATERENGELLASENVLAGAIEGVVTYANRTTAIVNKLGRQQQLFGRKVGEITEELKLIKAALLRKVMHPQGILDKHYELIRLQIYLSVIRQHVGQLQGLFKQDHSRFAACQSGTVSEDLLSLKLLEQILLTPENDLKLPHQNYYQYITVEAIFRDVSGRYVCKLSVPLLNAEPYKTFKITTYPTVRPNGQFLRIHHDTHVAISNGQTFSPQSCIGDNNMLCQPGLFEPANPCLNGLLAGDAAQQSFCSATYQPTNPHGIAEIGENRYVTYTPEATYNLTCDGDAPVYGEITKGLHIIRIHWTCIMETELWTIHGRGDKTKFPLQFGGGRPCG